jgi:hypothetical protein
MQISAFVRFEAPALDRPSLLIIQLSNFMQVYLAENFGGCFMKDERKLPFSLAAAIAAGLLLAILPIACASTGNFMPLASGEKVIGTAQSSFTVYNSLNASRDVINTQAYIKLLEKAQEQYGKDALIDVRDIVWVATKDVITLVDTEYSATGKVILVQ